jgi:hypothetical protein
MVRQSSQIVLAVSSSWEVDQENGQKELTGIKQAMAETGAEKGFSINNNQVAPAEYTLKLRSEVVVYYSPGKALG